MDISKIIANEKKLESNQVSAVIGLLSEGNTIPFIARYRKERTGNLDEVQLRDIRDRNEYLIDLENLRKSVLNSIEEQGKLTEALKSRIDAAATKQILKDLYLPYKPKRRTRATAAREMGLEPLAERIRDQSDCSAWLNQYLEREDVEIDESKAVQSAGDIVAEWISEDAEIREKIRLACWSKGVIHTRVHKEFEGEKSKYERYYDYSESIGNVPAHRYLAIRRGEQESVLKIGIESPMDDIVAIVRDKWIDSDKTGREQLAIIVDDALHRPIMPSIETEIRLILKRKADEESIKVFGENLKKLLLAPLGGAKTILGIDPGFVSGSKWVVVDSTGKLMEKGTIFPVSPRNQTAKSEKILEGLIRKHRFDTICIGNGTASREVMQFVGDYLKKAENSDIEPVFVNESGASVYSASDLAREEFPDLDVSYRGAVSIGRRFQDPLAELVKIDPKSIGVGQYQHDVDQKKLKRSLDEVVESCVNYVGINLNTASASLLSYVSGLNAALAKGIVDFRNEHGAFGERGELLKVPRFGPKCFEQSAGFLKIGGGKNPLDQSAVHPENYTTVLKMAGDLDLVVSDLIGNEAALNRIVLSKYETEEVGLLTLKDIVAELKKPGRDPRTVYVAAKLDDDVRKAEDVKVGMELEGTVTNLTKFGVFVDLGVHLDGLVHISELSNRFVKEASEVCGVGDVVTVRVLRVDLKRNRIKLTMKPERSRTKKKTPPKRKQSKKSQSAGPQPKSTGKAETDIQALIEKFKGL